MSYHNISYQIMSYRIISYHIISYHTVSLVRNFITYTEAEGCRNLKNCTKENSVIDIDMILLYWPIVFNIYHYSSTRYQLNDDNDQKYSYNSLIFI